MKLENEEIQRAESGRAKMRDSKLTTPFPSTKRPRKTAHFCAVSGTAHSPSVSEGALATCGEHMSLPSFPGKSRRTPPENKKYETNPKIGCPYELSILFSKTYNHHPYPTVEPKPLALHPRALGPTKLRNEPRSRKPERGPDSTWKLFVVYFYVPGNQRNPGIMMKASRHSRSLCSSGYRPPCGLSG